MFVVVRPTPDAEPLFASSHPRVVAAVLDVLVELAGGSEPPRLLRLVDHCDDPGRDIPTKKGLATGVEPEVLSP
jgi:hypothetical protein